MSISFLPKKEKFFFFLWLSLPAAVIDSAVTESINDDDKTLTPSSDYSAAVIRL